MKLSLKIAVYIIDPTSKSCHAMDLISKSCGMTAGTDGVLHPECSSLNHSKVSSSGNKSGLAVGNSNPQIKPRTYTEEIE